MRGSIAAAVMLASLMGSAVARGEEPPAPPPPGWWTQTVKPDPPPRRSLAMMITGISLAGVGGTLMAAGTVTYLKGASCDSAPFTVAVSRNSNGVVSQNCGSDAGTHQTGMTLIVAGAIGGAVGIPLAIAGSLREEPVARIVVGPSGVAASWRF